MSEKNKPELLPCPFCGGVGCFSNMTKIVSAAPSGRNFTTYRAMAFCGDCDCVTVIGLDDTEELAKQTAAIKWNRRTPPVPQWTTERPKEEGWYQVLYSGKHVACINIVNGQEQDDLHGLGLYEEPENIDEIGSHFVSLEDYSRRYDITGWCKIDFPPLPEGKDSDE